MQPSFRGRRRIGRELRPDHPLAYERLSDPILVRRAKDGDRAALAALCERHAPRVERVARHVLGLHSRCDVLDEDTRVAAETGPLRAAELSELRQELRGGLAELPAQQARVVVLKDAFGFSFREISDASGMPVGTAKCYAHRGRAGLRAHLEGDAVALAATEPGASA